MTIQDLYATRSYQTREEYTTLTGKACPPYNPDKPQKYWEDPQIRLGKRIGSFVQYPFGLVRDVDGSWTIGPFIVPLSEAVTVNIPPDSSLPPSTNSEVVPVPLTRGLRDNEIITFGFGGIPVLTTVGDNLVDLLNELESIVRKIRRRIESL